MKRNIKKPDTKSTNYSQLSEFDEIYRFDPNTELLYSNPITGDVKTKTGVPGSILIDNVDIVPDGEAKQAYLRYLIKNKQLQNATISDPIEQGVQLFRKTIVDPLLRKYPKNYYTSDLNNYLSKAEISSALYNNYVYGNKFAADYLDYKQNKYNALDRRKIKYIKYRDKLNKRFNNFNKYQDLSNALQLAIDGLQYNNGDNSTINNIEIGADVGGIIGATNILEKLPGRLKPIGWSLDKILDYVSPTLSTYDIYIIM